MAEYMAEPGGLDPGISGRGMVEPSVLNALPHFLSLTVFPLLICAVVYGGWWIIGPFVYFGLANWFDSLFGMEKRNMDPGNTLESQLFLYKLAVWMWAVMWPVTLVLSLWLMLVADHLAVWESALITITLFFTAQSIFIVGHELVHRTSWLERRFGEFLLASSSYPHYATEHIYVHHSLACTPADPGSARKGQSFWQYFPRDLRRSLIESWRFERDRLARRHLPVWHYTNPFWRYSLETAAWYALVYWMGGIWVALVFAVLCFLLVLSMKIVNYVQHYGLERIRLPGGRYEPVLVRHSWSAASKFTNWLYYNMQRHSDHHTEATRYYPLLQYHGEDESPQLPEGYSAMANYAMVPRVWFRKMDPLVDRWRAHFYPQIEDWSAYDSAAYAACPDEFEAISEIYDAAPRMAEWINRAPELLESLRDREFTALDLPDGFAPDPEFEMVARRGLARVYWTREFDVSEMKEQLAAIPAQGVKEVVETARNWLNDKVFQISMHMIRGNLQPTEAGSVLSNLAEASLCILLTAVEVEFANRRRRRGEGAVTAVLLGESASGEAAPGAWLDVMFAYEGGPVEYYQALCRRFLEELRTFSHENLLFQPLPRGGKGRGVWSVAEFAEHYRGDTVHGLPDLVQARCVFESGDPGTWTRLDTVRHEILSSGASRIAQAGALREALGAGTAEPGLQSIEEMRGGLRELVQAARLVQLAHAEEAPEILVPDTASAFRTAGSLGLIAGDVSRRLADAAEMWLNLHGILRLVVKDGFAIEKASPKVQAVIARSCGMKDFSALTGAIHETAARTAADIDALGSTVLKSNQIS